MMYFSARRPKIFTTSFGSTSDGGGGRGGGDAIVAATVDDLTSSDVVDDDKTTSSPWQFDVLDVQEEGRVTTGAKLRVCPTRIAHSRA